MNLSGHPKGTSTANCDSCRAMTSTISAGSRRARTSTTSGPTRLTPTLQRHRSPRPRGHGRRGTRSEGSSIERSSWVGRPRVVGSEGRRPRNSSARHPRRCRRWTSSEHVVTRSRPSPAPPLLRSHPRGRRPGPHQTTQVVGEPRTRTIAQAVKPRTVLTHLAPDDPSQQETARSLSTETCRKREANDRAGPLDMHRESARKFWVSGRITSERRRRPHPRV